MIASSTFRHSTRQHSTLNQTVATPQVMADGMKSPDGEFVLFNDAVLIDGSCRAAERGTAFPRRFCGPQRLSSSIRRRCMRDRPC